MYMKIDNWLNQMWYKLNIKDWTAPQHRINLQSNPSWVFLQSDLASATSYTEVCDTGKTQVTRPIEIPGESKSAKGKALLMN